MALLQALALLMALLTADSAHALTVKSGQESRNQMGPLGDGVPPLTVSQTVPGSLAAESAAVEVAGNDPILVVFSRPVFPLCANLGEAALQPDKAPFVLSPPVPGNWTWVSTYEARWDVAGSGWPSDQSITLRWNLDLHAFDGSRLQVEREVATLRTWACGLLDVQMVSERATQATQGMWAADWRPETHAALEFPPDGELVVELTCPVETQALATALQVLRVDSGTMEVGKAAAGVTLGTRTCDDLSQREQPPLVREPRNCVVVFLNSGGLEAEQLYAIGLPAGSSLGRRAARLSHDVGVLVSGLRPFRFWAPEEPLTRFTRLELFLSHGMNAETADSALGALLQLRPSDSPSAGLLPLNISFPRRKPGSLSTGPVMQLRADLRPNTSYTLQVEGSDKVMDIFGQPMESSTLRFRTRPAPSLFEPLQAGYDKRANFETLSTWPVVSSNSGARAALRLWPVKEACQAQAAVASMYNAEAFSVDSGDESCPLLSFASAVAPSLSTINSSQAVELFTETEHLLDGQQLFLSQKAEVVRRTTGRLDISADWVPESTAGDVTVVQRAWVALSAVTAGEEVAVWATALEGGGPIEGANVTLYRLVNGGSTGDADRAEAIKTATTDAEGLAVFRFPPADDLYTRPGRGRLTVALASSREGPNSDGPTSLMLLDKVQPPSPTPPIHTTGALMFDRSAVAPGDTLHIKGWVRQLLSDADEPAWRAPTSGRFELWLRVKANFGLVNTFQPPMGPAIRLPVSTDDEVGGFEAVVEVPLSVDVSVQRVSFDLMWLPPKHAPARKVRLSSGDDAPSVAIKWPSAPSTATAAAFEGVAGALTDFASNAVIATSDASRSSSMRSDGGWADGGDDDFPEILELRTSVPRPLPGQPFGVAVCVARDSDGRLQSQLSCPSPRAPLHVVVKLEAQDDAGPLASCRLQVGMDVVEAFNACRFTLGRNDASRNGLQLRACPVAPATGFLGRKLRFMGLIDFDNDDDCESMALFPQTRPSTGAILKVMPAPEVIVVQQQGSYSVGDEVTIAVDTPSKGARALLRWGYGSRFRSLTAPLRQGFSRLDFVLGPECALGVCDFYLTIHVPRQNLDDGGWAGPALPRSKLLDPLAPYTVRQVLTIPVAPMPPPAPLRPRLQLLSMSDDGGQPLPLEAGNDDDDTVSVAFVNGNITVQVGLEGSSGDEAVEMVVVVVDASVAPAVPRRLGAALVSSDLPSMCPQRSCMAASNAHLVASDAATTALEAALGYIRMEPWLDPSATSDEVQGSLLSLFPAPQSNAPNAADDFHTAVDLAPEAFLGQFKDCLTYFPITYDAMDCLPVSLSLRPGSTMRPPHTEQPTARVPQRREDVAGTAAHDEPVDVRQQEAVSPAKRSFAQNMTLALVMGERIEEAASEGRRMKRTEGGQARFSLDVDPVVSSEASHAKSPNQPKPPSTSTGGGHDSSQSETSSGTAAPLLSFQVVRSNRSDVDPIALPLSLPSTPGDYRVIAVGVSANGSFGSSQTTLRVRTRGVWLRPDMPPVVHVGDAFPLRLNVRAPRDDALLLEVSVLDGGLELLTPGSTMLHPKAGSGEVAIRLKAVQPGGAVLRVTASGAEPLQLSFEVQPVSDVLRLFESFTISGYSSRRTAVQLDPQWMALEGNLTVSVASDHLPVILHLTEEALRGSTPTRQLNSEHLLARLAAASVLRVYADNGHSVAQLSAMETAADEAADELKRRTVDCCGLLPSAAAPLRPDMRLNAWALWLVRQLEQLSAEMSALDDVKATWRAALSRAAVRRINGAAEVPLDVLLAVRMGMAPDWRLPVCGDADVTLGADAGCVSSSAAAIVAGLGVEGGEAWESRPGAWAGRVEARLGLSGLLSAGLAALEAPQERRDEPLLSRTLDEVRDAIRLRSTTTGGYLAEQDGSVNGLDAEWLSLSLLFGMRLQQSGDAGGNGVGQLSEWLAEAVTQRASREADVREAFLLPTPPPPPREVAAALLALQAYDEGLSGRVWAGSEAPRQQPSALTLQLHGNSEDEVLQLWESGDGNGGAHEVSVRVTRDTRLDFSMRGPASAVVGLRLNISPTAPPLKPLSRGVLVSAAWLDDNGSAVDELCLGQSARLAVTLSAHDPLQSVEVTINMPGGMLASRARDSSAGVTASCGPSSLRPYTDIYACPDVTVRPSLVVVRYTTLPRGTSSLRVDAVATHVGQFISPPVLASSVNDASIGGASAAAALTVRDSCM